MKLRILAIAAGFVVLPAIAYAQGKDTTATAKDTTAAAKDTTATAKDTTATSTMKATNTTATATRRTTRATRKSTSNGTDCPRGCPTSHGAAGLTGVQFLALQQELRDRGCGNAHVTGVYDGATRHAVAVCAKQLSVANSAAAVLTAFNIGYSAGDMGAKPPGTTD